MKLTFAITKKQIALPLDVTYDFRVSHWLVAIRFLIFVVQFLHIYAPKVVDVPAKAASAEPEYMKPTKAYADQRQKAKRNRRRRPKKAMANLYQLERN